MKLDTQPQPQEVWSRNRIPIRIRSAALTMIDNQNMFCKPEGAMIRSHLKIGSSERREAMLAYLDRVARIQLPNTQRLLAFYRKHSLPIIHVMTGCWGPDYREFPPNFRDCILDIEHRADMSLNYYFGTWDTQIVDELGPRVGEAIVRKRGSSAFASSDIDWVLHTWGIKAMVMTGNGTGGCVWATAFEASERGYGIVALADAVDSPAPLEKQKPAWERFHSIGQVCTTEELIADFTRQLEDQPRSTLSMQERENAS